MQLSDLVVGFGLSVPQKEIMPRLGVLQRTILPKELFDASVLNRRPGSSAGGGWMQQFHPSALRAATVHALYLQGRQPLLKSRMCPPTFECLPLRPALAMQALNANRCYHLPPSLSRKGHPGVHA